MIEISYNNLALNTLPFTVSSYNGYDLATRDVKSIELARTDGAIEVSSRMASRTITVEGTIKTADRAGLIGAIDNLKAYLYNSNGNLIVVDDDNVERTWQVTPTNFTVAREAGSATTASFSINFYSAKPYSVSGSQTLLSTSLTTSPIALALSVQGTYPASPVITLTVNSFSTGVHTITIANPAQDRRISISSAFAPNDQITINSDTKDVYINTAKVDYTGSFPTWNTGGGSVEYSDTATARNIGIVMTYRIRNL